MPPISGHARLHRRRASRDDDESGLRPDEPFGAGFLAEMTRHLEPVEFQIPPFDGPKEFAARRRVRPFAHLSAGHHIALKKIDRETADGEAPGRFESGRPGADDDRQCAVADRRLKPRQIAADLRIDHTAERLVIEEPVDADIGANTRSHFFALSFSRFWAGSADQRYWPLPCRRRSASPSRRIASASSMVVTRPTVATGMSTASFTARDKCLNAPKGAGVGGQ